MSVSFPELTSQPNPDPSGIRQTRTVYNLFPVQVMSSGAHPLVLSGQESVAVEQPYQEVYRISGALPRGHWLHHSIPVEVWMEGVEYVASQPKLLLFAFGETPVDAIMNFRAELVEQYESLVLQGDLLGPQLMRLRDTLQRLFTARNA